VPTYILDVKRYVDFGPTDERLLAALHALVVEDLGAVAEHFYDVIRRHRGARAVLTGGQAQIERLKTTLVDWLVSGLLGPHDQAYYERRSRIGRRHVSIGLPQQYMFTAMNVVRRDLAGLIDVRVAEAERSATRDALDKLLDLELSIMLRHYQLEAEERLVRRERGAQAEKLVAMQTLSAGLAHEVRNPLNAAKLQLALLERRLRRAGAATGLLEATALVQHEIVRLTELLNEFLDFARPAEVAAANHDMVAIARQVIELERPAAASGGIALVLISTDARVEAPVDAGKIHQVIQNLVRNAVEASPRGVAVELVVARLAHGVSVTVRDRGPGIPAEILPRIYEPFFSTKEGGTGMGMAIVHSLVAMHGGHIEVAVDGGTTFTVVLDHRLRE